MTATETYDQIVGTSDLSLLFRPRTMAVIGAHDTKPPFDFMYRQLEARLKASGGTIFPINPRLTSVFGTPTYQDLQEVPGEVDVVVVLISDVAAAMKQVLEKRPKFVVIHASGFSEGGSSTGRDAEAELVEMARASGARLVGPNTNMNMFEVLDEGLTPKYGIVTQSGHQGRPIAAAQQLGYGISYWVTTGNEADLGIADFVEHMANDANTSAIASYVEGFTDGEVLRRAATACIETGTPWVLVKVGASEVAAAAALSHTGKLAGSDSALTAFFEQHAIHRVADLDELIDVTAVLARSSAIPPVDGVAVLGASGGTNTHLTDVLATAGLSIPTLSEETQARLRALLPSPLNVSNPVDNGGYALLRGIGPELVDIVMDDPSVGILVLPVSEPLPAMRQPLIDSALRAHSRGDKPVITVSLMPSTDEPIFRAMTDSAIPFARNMRNAASAARALLNHPQRRFPDGKAPSSTIPEVRTQTGAGTVLDELASLRWLGERGLVSAPHEYVSIGDSLDEAAGRLGYPLVLKAVVDDLSHKSERGAVKIGLRDAHDLDSAREALLTEFADEPLRGFVVASHLRGGVEMLVGITTDPLLGPVVMVGAGGTDAEAWRDTQLAVLPFNDDRIDELISRLRVAPLLGPWRGRSALDTSALKQAIKALRTIAESGEVAELDINPLLVCEKGAFMLDAVVSLA